MLMIVLSPLLLHWCNQVEELLLKLLVVSVNDASYDRFTTYIRMK